MPAAEAADSGEPDVSCNRARRFTVARRLTALMNQSRLRRLYVRSKSVTSVQQFARLPHRYGNSRATWDHTVLPATRQRWHSRPYPSRSWYSIKRPRRDARLSWPKLRPISPVARLMRAAMHRPMWNSATKNAPSVQSHVSNFMVIGEGARVQGGLWTTQRLWNEMFCTTPKAVHGHPTVKCRGYLIFQNPEMHRNH